MEYSVILKFISVSTQFMEDTKVGKPNSLSCQTTFAKDILENDDMVGRAFVPYRFKPSEFFEIT